MTQQEVLQKLTEFADRNELQFRFEKKRDGSYVSKEHYEYCEGEMAGIDIHKLVIIDAAGSVSCSLKAETQISQDKRAQISEYIGYADADSELAVFHYDEKNIISATAMVDYEAEEEESFDEDLIEAILGIPDQELTIYWEGVAAILDGSATPSEAILMVQEENEEEEIHSLAQARDYLEHDILPLYFFQKTEEFLQDLKEKKGQFLYEMIDQICAENDLENTLRLSEYDVKAQQEVQIRPESADGGSYQLVQIVMPHPENEKECSEIDILYDKALQNLRFFTIERGKSEGEVVLWEYDAEENEINYGVQTGERPQLLEKLTGLFKLGAETEQV